MEKPNFEHWARSIVDEYEYQGYKYEISAIEEGLEQAFEIGKKYAELNWWEQQDRAKSEFELGRRGKK